MSHVLRLSACVAVVAVVFTGAWVTQPVLLRDLGLDVWEWPDWQHSLDSQNERQKELVWRWQVAERRDQMKTRICQELIAGRITLREAARKIDELPDPPERLREDLRFHFPEGTDEERMCRHVIEWACDLTDREAELRRRLGEELQASFGRTRGRT